MMCLVMEILCLMTLISYFNIDFCCCPCVCTMTALIKLIWRKIGPAILSLHLVQLVYILLCTSFIFFISVWGQSVPIHTIENKIIPG